MDVAIKQYKQHFAEDENESVTDSFKRIFDFLKDVRQSQINLKTLKEQAKKKLELQEKQKNRVFQSVI